MRNEAYLYPDKHLGAHIIYRIRVMIASSGSGEQMFRKTFKQVFNDNNVVRGEEERSEERSGGQREEGGSGSGAADPELFLHKFA